MRQQKFTVQVTTLPDCDDITRFDGIQHGLVGATKQKMHRSFAVWNRKCYELVAPTSPC
jgi:hypothetical protein